MSSFRLTRAVTEDAAHAALCSHRALRRGRACARRSRPRSAETAQRPNSQARFALSLSVAR